MILVSVGTQLPFDRLIRTVDAWAAAHGRSDVVAQIGSSTYQPVAMQSFAHADYDRFRELQRRCALMVTHAGMGSIIAALEFGKPIIVLPRDHRLGEHRNGHQFATLQEFGKRAGVYPAESEQALVALLDRAETLTAGPAPGSDACDSFASRLSAMLSVPVRQSAFRRLRRRMLRGGRH